MAKIWTVEDLKKKTVKERSELYRNACRLIYTDEGSKLKRLLEEAGLPFSEEACLTNDDPITLKMHEIIFSPEGRKAAVAATNIGLPALAGVETMLQEALGAEYGKHNMATATAGGIVAELMLSLGYKRGASKQLPSHCVARSATFWK